MSQTPITVTYSLEEVLGQINQKLDTLHKDVTDFRIETKVAIEGIKGDIKALEVEVKGISKRLDTQEFINRSVIVGFVLAVGAGVFKLLFPNFSS